MGYGTHAFILNLSALNCYQLDLNGHSIPVNINKFIFYYRELSIWDDSSGQCSECDNQQVSALPFQNETNLSQIAGSCCRTPLWEDTKENHRLQKIPLPLWTKVIHDVILK